MSPQPISRSPRPSEVLDQLSPMRTDDSAWGVEYARSDRCPVELHGQALVRADGSSYTASRQGRGYHSM